MVKRHQLQKLDSGLIVPYWHAPTRDRSTIRRERNFLFTPSGACGCDCTVASCYHCSSGTVPESIELEVSGIIDTAYCDQCENVNGLFGLDFVNCPVNQCTWQYVFPSDMCNNALHMWEVRPLFESNGWKFAARLKTVVSDPYNDCSVTGSIVMAKSALIANVVPFDCQAAMDNLVLTANSWVICNAVSASITINPT